MSERHEAIWMAPVHRGPMDPLEHATPFGLGGVPEVGGITEGCGYENDDGRPE